eukprot:RCo048790
MAADPTASYYCINGGVLLLAVLLCGLRFPSEGCSGLASAEPPAASPPTRAELVFQNTMAVLRQHRNLSQAAPRIPMWPPSCPFAGPAPYLQAFLAPTPTRSRAAVLIIPGGAY